MPCLNEASCLPHVFANMPTDVSEVILVDGGSVDRSVEVAKHCYPSVKVVQQTRTGKGNALACGFAAATSDILVTLDADGSADPAEVPRFVAALCAGADFAKGSRFMAGGGSDDITRVRRLGNDGLTTLTNRLYGQQFTDLCYGYNAFWRRVLPALRLPSVDANHRRGEVLEGDGFEIETLMTLRAAAARLRILEVPSHEAHRLHGVSNLNAYRDGRRVLRTILTEYRAMRRPVLAEAPTSPAAGPAQPAPERREPGHVSVLRET
jgi:glycosyltransferase involved in cell wall biosynthesis